MTAPVFIAASTHSQSSTPTSFVVNKPTGTLDAHVMYACFASDGNLSASLAGWTAVTSVLSTDSDQELVVLRKVASGEGASYTFTTSGAFTISGAILTYSLANTTTPTNVFGSQASGNDTEASPQTVVAPSVTTTVADCMLLYIATVDLTSFTAGSSWAPPAGYTERVDIIDPSFLVPFTVAEKAQAVAGASGTASGVCTTSPSRTGEGIAIHLAIASADGGGAGSSLAKKLLLYCQ